MTAEEPPPSAPLTLTDEMTLSAFQLVADTITELAGFGVAVISVMSEDGLLHTAVVAGSESARAALAGTTSSLDRLADELARADDWGAFRFVPAERIDEEEPWGWIPDISPDVGTDAWHPLDMLIAPLHDSDGVLRATLALDLPANGRRPSPEERPTLTRYAEYAARIIVTALDRERLSDEVRLRRLTRDIVRQAAAQLSSGESLQATADAIVAAFGVLGTRLWLFADGGQRRITSAGSGLAIRWDPALHPLGERASRRLWLQQRFGLIGPEEAVNAEGTPSELARVRRTLRARGIESVLYAPLGAGHVPLGMVFLYRAPGSPAWTEAERCAVQELGRDLGTMVDTAQESRREHRVVRELQALDDARSRLTATVSHELKSPLMAVRANVELLEHTSADDRELRERALSAVARGSARLCRLVDGLREFSRLGDPRASDVRQPVDLGLLVEQSLALAEATAARRRITLVHHRGDAPVLANPDEMDHLVVNLIDNAVKYSHPGGTVSVTTARDGDEVELEIRDAGIGISETDQQRLFAEFFRSADPAARAEPGTGLGLAIVDRVVRRHHGRIVVASSAGVGSTFRVFLPALGGD